MGDLTKLKVAVGQPELVSGSASANARTRERMVERALDLGADLLVMPGSLTDEHDVHLVVLNDSRLDVAGSAVYLEACGESYRIGLTADDDSCDFSVVCDTFPFTIAGDEEAPALPLGVPCILLRPVGMLNVGRKVVAFDGGSSVFDSFGNVTARLSDDFTEDVRVVQLTGQGSVTQPYQDKVLAACVETLRRFDAQVLPWEPKWVIGLSGGLDSSIVATLLTEAFGSSRVVGYNLATKYNSDATKSNAASLAEMLGIPLRNGSIEQLVDATGSVLVEYGYGEDALQGLVLENVQARVRGHLLSTFAAVEGGVVANNGNRVECALGYATLYGDAIGAMAPIGDLTKVQLFDLARSVNASFGAPYIPENLLPQVTDEGLEWQTPPSAELADGQTDPMKWFYHDWLIARLLDSGDVDTAACDVMQGYLDDRLTEAGMDKWLRFYGLYDDPRAFADDLDWVLRSMRNAAFKRIQSPPALVMASAASVCAPLDVQGPIDPSPRFMELLARIRS